MEAEQRKLVDLDSNSSCVDCSEKWPMYADLTHNVFVCARCAAIHRNFDYRVQDFSNSTLQEDHVIALSKGGNKAFNSKFLAKRDPRELLPDGNRCDINVLRKFIKCKYYDRKWFDDSNDSPKEEQGQDQEQVLLHTDASNNQKAEPRQSLKDEQLLRSLEITEDIYDGIWKTVIRDLSTEETFKVTNDAIWASLEPKGQTSEQFLSALQLVEHLICSNNASFIIAAQSKWLTSQVSFIRLKKTSAYSDNMIASYECRSKATVLLDVMMSKDWKALVRSLRELQHEKQKLASKTGQMSNHGEQHLSKELKSRIANLTAIPDVPVLTPNDSESTGMGDNLDTEVVLSADNAPKSSTDFLDGKLSDNSNSSLTQTSDTTVAYFSSFSDLIEFEATKQPDMRSDTTSVTHLTDTTVPSTPPPRNTGSEANIALAGVPASNSFLSAAPSTDLIVFEATTQPVPVDNIMGLYEIQPARFPHLSTESNAEQAAADHRNALHALLQSFTPDVRDALRSAERLREVVLRVDAHDRALQLLVSKKADCPSLFWFYPKKRTWRDWLLEPVKNLFNDTMMMVVVCPMTLRVVKCGPDGVGWELTSPKYWVKKWGPAILFSIYVLQAAALAGRAVGVPIPQLPSPGAVASALGLGRDAMVSKEQLMTCLSAVTNATVEELGKDTDHMQALCEQLKLQQEQCGLASFVPDCVLSAGLPTEMIAESHTSIHNFLTTGANFALGTLEYQLQGAMQRVYSDDGDGSIEWVSLEAVDLWKEKHRRIKSVPLQLEAPPAPPLPLLLAEVPPQLPGSWLAVILRQEGVDEQLIADCDLKLVRKQALLSEELLARIPPDDFSSLVRKQIEALGLQTILLSLHLELRVRHSPLDTPPLSPVTPLSPAPFTLEDKRKLDTLCKNSEAGSGKSLSPVRGGGIMRTNGGGGLQLMPPVKKTTMVNPLTGKECTFEEYTISQISSLREGFGALATNVDVLRENQITHAEVAEHVRQSHKPNNMGDIENMVGDLMHRMGTMESYAGNIAIELEVMKEDQRAPSDMEANTLGAQRRK